MSVYQALSLMIAFGALIVAIMKDNKKITVQLPGDDGY
ncbi:putative holin-like toxin [Lacticaseibacillus manihotivorans]|nr:putative holin-like toxin [Lacticaseibacillus manihotivorans]